MKAINAIRMGGVEVLPLVEGGKGVAVSNGTHLRRLGVRRRRRHLLRRQCRQLRRRRHAVIRQVYHGKTRRERHEELVAYGIAGGIAQAREAHERAGGMGRIHANILWEMGGAERVARGILGRRQGADQRHHLRRRHALSAGRHRPRLQRLLLPHHLLRRAPSSRCGSAATARRANCWAAWSTRTPGWPAAITACPTARTRPSRRTPIPAC